MSHRRRRRGHRRRGLSVAIPRDRRLSLAVTATGVSVLAVLIGALLARLG